MGLINQLGETIFPTEYDLVKSDYQDKERAIYGYGQNYFYNSNSTLIGHKKIGKESEFNLSKLYGYDLILRKNNLSDTLNITHRSDSPSFFIPIKSAPFH